MPVDVWWYASRECWCADVPTGEGRKRLYLGKDKEKARAQLYRHLAEYHDAMGEEENDSKPVVQWKGSSISLLELAVRFLKWAKANRAFVTWRSYKTNLKYITRPHKDKLAAELGPQDVEKVKTEMINKGYRGSTVNRMVGAVKRLYNWGCTQDLVEENPVDGVRAVSKYINGPKNPEPKHLPLEKARHCIELCRNSPPMGDVCEFLLLTGMRVGEVVRMTWQGISFKERMIRLQRHKTSGYTDRPRTIPLSSRALEILQKQANKQSELKGAVFRGAYGQQLRVPALHSRLERLRETYPELEDFTFHKLRHTCATYLARQKVPERVAQAILGHSSTLMTRYYTATDPDEMVDAVERLSEAAEKNRQ